MACDDGVRAPSAIRRTPLHPFLLAGPTAVGKSAVALRLAGRLGGEIISVDSMQVYRGLDLGTAKPTPAERQRVPHHLIDVADLSEAFDAAQFAALAHRAVREIQARGRPSSKASVARLLATPHCAPNWSRRPCRTCYGNWPSAIRKPSRRSIVKTPAAWSGPSK